MKKLGLTKLAFPLYGLFHHPISEAKNTISRVFSGSNIEIIVCTAQSVSINYYYFKEYLSANLTSFKKYILTHPT